MTRFSSAQECSPPRVGVAPRSLKGSHLFTLQRGDEHSLSLLGKPS